MSNKNLIEGEELIKLTLKDNIECNSIITNDNIIGKKGISLLNNEIELNENDDYYKLNINNNENEKGLEIYNLNYHRFLTLKENNEINNNSETTFEKPVLFNNSIDCKQIHINNDASDDHNPVLLKQFKYTSEVVSIPTNLLKSDDDTVLYNFNVTCVVTRNYFESCLLFNNFTVAGNTVNSNYYIRLKITDYLTNHLFSFYTVPYVVNQNNDIIPVTITRQGFNYITIRPDIAGFNYTDNIIMKNYLYYNIKNNI